MSPDLRSGFLVLFGAALGAGGFWLSQPAPGSRAGEATPGEIALQNKLDNAQARISSLQMDLKKAGVAATATPVVESSDDKPIKDDGGELDLNDVFKESKPLLRRFAPILERMRREGQKGALDARVKDLAAKYKLNESQQAAVKRFLEDKADRDAALMQSVMLAKGTSLDQIMTAGQLAARSQNDGLDAFMTTVLTGDELKNYENTRLAERATSVTNEANHRMERLNAVVALDETQKDKIFGISARSHKDYDTGMKIDGVGSDNGAIAPGQSRDEAILAVLTPDQRQKYEADQTRRRDEATKRFRDLGIKPPANLDLFDNQ